ncbi:MAG: GNAT family N-acetyltransferase [Oscillospiraceae bacterium]
MIEMRIAKAGEEQAQRALWVQAFGDDDGYIDLFYRDCYAPEHTLVLLEDGVLCTMASFIQMTLHLPDGTTRNAAYIYALATHSDTRNKGFGRQILNYADFYLKEQGFDCVCTVPAEVTLHRFFESVGYDECFATRKLERMNRGVWAAAEGDEIVPVTAHEYNALRDEILKGTFYMAYEDSWVAHQKNVSVASGADLYRLTVGGVTGIAAAEYYDCDSVGMKELLLPEKHLERGAGLVKSVLPALRYHIRTPGFGESMAGSYGQTFAMVKWYRKQDAGDLGLKTTGYFGLALD